MSRASIEQALTGLVPTFNGPLPPELVDLAVSLLARSRSVAHSLKPDEEIARPYACAELACERLKKRLNLPAIASRPPCPPRIYKKLFTYLQSALPPPAPAQDPETPRKQRPSAPTSARTTPKTPLSGRKTPRSTRKDEGAVDTPEWVMPTIRALVKVFECPKTAPHVYTGVEIILPLLARMSAAAAAAPPDTPSKRSRRMDAANQPPNPPLSDSRVLGLIATLFFYVLIRMMDRDITPTEFVEWQDKAISTLLKSSVGKGIDETVLANEIQGLMPMAKEEGWLQMEWLSNVVPDAADEMEGVEITNGTSSGEQNPNLRRGRSDYIGLGTMIQDATDYLGEQQRADYESWKAKVIARIQEIEAS
ncbi:hypothetical protein BS50DRAFT_481648 [Corynespora cassiicola Philippines]|uniref:ORC6 first cyclin-like domain-containing protein n=1 Tax=Corynespora cassiicola Philippines TaxID=1448308 RepID=A0A2T2P6I4_CORCC|nr:hypothetical protein BS50DRAFT_481648 [Corynespora cassiicola Philippines]